MKTLLILSWRNIWRNKRRTFILVCAMMAGLVGVLLSMGLTNSWLVQIKDNAVRLFAGHIKIHAAGYHDRPSVEFALAPTARVTERLGADPRVKAWAERVSVQALLSTASQSRVINLVGIDPEAEVGVSVILDSVQEGVPLDAWDQPGRPILIGRRLADRIERGLGKKLVLMSQQSGNNEVGSGAFRIAGIFDSGNGGFDESHVYIFKEDAQRMLALGDRITETVIMLHDMEQSDLVAAELRAMVEGDAMEALSWRERLPLVEKTIEMSRQMMIPYYAIFYVAMAFGILNTLLMAIGERTHEIGVMLAIGLNRWRLIGMILLESLLIAILSVFVGAASGWGLVAWWGARGIDLSSMAEGLAYMGVSRIIYPSLRSADLIGASAAALAVALVFALYPAWRASRLAPVEAIRSD